MLLLHDEGGAWVELPFLMVSGEEDLPWPRPQREWEDWGPACWLVEQTHSSHPALKVDHRDHEHEVPVLDQDLLVIGGVAALDVSTIEVQLEGATHTITVDRQTGVFLGVLNSTEDPTLIARFTDGSTEFL